MSINREFSIRVYRVTTTLVRLIVREDTAETSPQELYVQFCYEMSLTTLYIEVFY